MDYSSKPKNAYVSVFYAWVSNARALLLHLAHTHPLLLCVNTWSQAAKHNLWRKNQAGCEVETRDKGKVLKMVKWESNMQILWNESEQ